MIPKQGRFYGALIWACSGLFLSAGGLLAILMLSNVIGPFRFQEPRGDPISRVVGFWMSEHAPGDRDVPAPIEDGWDRVPRGWTSATAPTLAELEREAASVYVVTRSRGLDADDAAALAPRVRDGAGAVLVSPTRPSRLAGEPLRWASVDTTPPGWRARLGRGRIAWIQGSGVRATQPILADALETQLAWVAREPTFEVRTRPSALQARVLRAGPHRLRVQVTNRGDVSLSGAVIRVHLNRPVRRVKSEATTLGQRPTPLAFLPEHERVDLLLPELAPHESQAYHLDLDEDATATLR